MLKIALYSSIILLLIMQACSTKLDVNTKNARELIVVYGFLDANKTTQYIRINKAILGKDNEEIDALSKDPNANLYGAGELDAYVQRGELVVKTNGATDTIYKEKYTLTQTFYARSSDGAFNLVFTGADSSRFKGNGVYQFSFASAPINDKKMRESVYKLVATVKDKNIIATAITPLIYSVDTYDSSSISLSTLSSEFYNNQWFTNGIQLFNSNTSSDLAGSRAIKFSTVPSVNAHKYQIFYRQHITDYSNIDTSIGTKRNYYVDIDCGYYLPEYYIDKNTKKYTLNLNIEPTVGSITGLNIATELSNIMKQKAYAPARKLGIASIVVYAIGEELKTYLDVNNANYGLNIDKPNYSNVSVSYKNENIVKQGLGIFSCYTSGVKFYYDVNSTVNNVYTKKTYRSNTFFLNLYSYQKIGLAAINLPYNFKYYYKYTNTTVPYNYIYKY
ncbi:MAG: hypothetical protein H7331_04120 [Bacteroidia bacterium]|nr:hypothetical protein [Bacteroidia bacterium]